MNQRRLWISLIGIVSLAVVLFGVNLLVGNAPILGLDLQGGISVILAPDRGASHDDLLVIRDLIRDELENRGIAEPDVRVEGSNIIVDLPGVKDQRDALDAVDVAGIVSLRPVMQPCTAAADDTATSTTLAPDTGTSVPGSGPIDSSGRAESSGPTESAVSSGSLNPASTAAAPAGYRRAQTPASTEPGSSEPASSEPASSELASSESASTAEASNPASTEPAATTTTLPPLGPLGTNPLNTVAPGDLAPPPPPSDDSTIELSTRDGLTCLVGPVQRGPNGESGGFVFSRNSAQAVIQNGSWAVNVDLSSDGKTTFNQLASECFNAQATCPTKQLAIVLDDIIQSAPTVQQSYFPDKVTISGSFSESDARSLARVLNRGAFPVNVEAQNVQTVSATLGSDSMKAAVFAGLVGVALVMLLLVYFYRRLIVIVIAGISVWALLIYSAASFISQTTNFALTLAGVTGMIVSIGVTVDSYVVYFERLKDEVRHGRTIRNSSMRAFKGTWRTILAADFVSILAAVVLFVLSVGSVRGFALYLGVTTVCDLVVCYFFTRPAVVLLAGTGWLDKGDTFGLKEYE